MVHVPPPANDAPQVVAEMVKSPLAAIDVMLTEDEVMFFTVVLFAALVKPNTSLPKAKLAGVRLRTGVIVKLEV
jgi:hypothetical protein